MMSFKQRDLPPGRMALHEKHPFRDLEKQKEDNFNNTNCRHLKEKKELRKTEDCCTLSAAVAEPAPGGLVNQAASPSYFVRLGKLSAKVQERAREQSLARARQARDVTYAAVAQITSTLDLLERARSSLGSATTQIGEATEQLQQQWTEWKQKQAGDAEAEPDEAKNEAEVSAEAVGEFKAIRYAITFRM